MMFGRISKATAESTGSALRLFHAPVLLWVCLRRVGASDSKLHPGVQTVHGSLNMKLLMCRTVMGHSTKMTRLNQESHDMPHEAQTMPHEAQTMPNKAQKMRTRVVLLPSRRPLP
jgi:hypothetical protein